MAHPAHTTRPPVATQRSCQLDPLRFTAGQCGRETIQRQVVKTHRVEKIQPLPHFQSECSRQFRACMGVSFSDPKKLLAPEIVSAAVSQIFLPES